MLTSRSDYPQGGLRQFDAILGTGSLKGFTRRITVPTVVIHGSKDPMVRIRNGRNLARTIGGARFVVVDGMGHDLPEPAWRPIVEALTENFGIPLIPRSTRASAWSTTASRSSPRLPDSHCWASSAIAPVYIAAATTVATGSSPGWAARVR